MDHMDMQQESLTPTGDGARVDLLTLAFKAACQRGQVDTAASLLSEIDAALLGEPMGFKQRESALMRVRAFRNELERVRSENPPSKRARNAAAESLVAWP